MTVQYIDVQYKDGRDERTEGDDLLECREEITADTPGIQYAAWFVPKRSGGYKAAGVFGVTRDEAAAAREASMQADKDRTMRALKAMHAVRDWTWTPPQMDRHL
jgi:hypothetical protein